MDKIQWLLVWTSGINDNSKKVVRGTRFISVTASVKLFGLRDICFVISSHAVCLIWVNEILLSFVFVEVLKDFVPCRCDIGQIRLKPECSFMSKNGRAEIRCNGRAHRKSRCATSPQGVWRAIIWMCVVLLALRINVSLELRKTQGTLPFSQSISQSFDRLLSQRNIEESETHCLRPILKL